MTAELVVDASEKLVDEGEVGGSESLKKSSSEKSSGDKGRGGGLLLISGLGDE